MRKSKWNGAKIDGQERKVEEWNGMEWNIHNNKKKHNYNNAYHNYQYNTVLPPPLGQSINLFDLI
jgi:hypothetical protein